MATPNLQCVILLWIIALINLAQAFESNWGLYIWSNQPPTLGEVGHRIVTFTHPEYTGLSVSIQGENQQLTIKQVFNGYNNSQFSLFNGNGSLKLFSLMSKNSLGFKITGKMEQTLIIAVSCLHPICSESSKMQFYKIIQSLSTQSITTAGGDQQKLCTKQLSQNRMTLACRFAGSHQKQLYLGSQKSDFDSLYEMAVNKNQQNLQHFFNKYSVKQFPNNIQIVKTALSNLVSSICIFEEEGSVYYGFCQKKDSNLQYNVKLAAMVICILADYDYQLAEMIYQDYFSIISNRMRWSIEKQHDLPFPEYIEVFTRFGTPETLMKNEAELLNSLFVNPMLSKLGTLHQQLNYRQAKKLHPFLIEMLTQAWESNVNSSPLLKFKSVYSESFTEDFKYHEYGAKLYQSITKNSWLYNAIDVYSGIVAEYYSIFMSVEQIKEEMKEHFSLLNIFKSYLDDDESVTKGRYQDVVEVEDGLKYYSKYIGYGNILPFIYRIGRNPPIEVIKQLQSKWGIKSSNQQQYEKKYKYRGDIHSYFNYRIIEGVLKRMSSGTKADEKLISQQSRKQMSALLKSIGKSIWENVKINFAEKSTIYTSWDVLGNGKQAIGWLQIVSALFAKYQ